MYPNQNERTKAVGEGGSYITPPCPDRIRKMLQLNLDSYKYWILCKKKQRISRAKAVYIKSNGEKFNVAI